MTIENSLEWLKHHPVILIISILIVIVSSITTLIKAGKDLYQFYKKTIGYNAELDNLLNSLSVEVDIGYLNSALGSPAIKNCRLIRYKISRIKSLENPLDLEEKEEEANYNEYFYIHKHYYVQAIVDQNGKVGMYSITSRSKKYLPQLKTDLGFPIRLGKSTYSDITVKPLKVAGLRGMNLKHFNYYEVYLFEPGNYRHAVLSTNPNGYIGKVGRLDWEIGDIFAKQFPIDSNEFPMHKKHQDFRKNTTINTYTVSTPWFMGIDLTDDGVNYGEEIINFGPYIDQISMIKSA